NTIPYFVDVVPGGFDDACGIPTTCNDGTGLSGERIDLAESCFPGSGFNIVCETFSQCPEDQT
ncbi:MAG: hypothetical protein AAF658_22220, partial [Myxococcota bacterium]